jgi:putative integral membrane protein (TIGR02587 family)
VAETARDHLRAVAGGLLVGLPLLWTMEVWEDGAVLAPGKMVVLLAVGFLVVVGFNTLAGFRRDRTWVALLIDAVQGMGISAVVAAVALAVLGRLDPGLGMPTLVGRVAVESLPIAFGASLAATVMAPPDEDDKGGPGDQTEPVGPIGRLLVAAGGALYFALNIAPTDEVRMLGAEASAPQLAVAVIASLAVGLAIVFHAEFRGGRRAGTGDGPLASPLGETAAAYALSLLVSLLLLWAFGSTDGTGLDAVLAQVVMLGIVASFGAAAARLLVGAGQGSVGRDSAT